ncbi:MAG TPA: molybdopterin cofactor-binding domain-containing protein, partial [Chloroflexota bacterium]|nr:molybdopterin cofactor-binding domain-containing protein [Chloroflexota bacterium]
MPDSYIGAPIKRVEDPRLLRGAGSYVDDQPALHVAFVRSPYAHARIVAISTSEARALEGVVEVVTMDDLGDVQTAPPNLAVEDARGKVAPPLARDTVRFVAEPVVAIVAESRYVAEDAARAVQVEYEPLPAVAHVEAALAPDAPQLHDNAPGNVCYRIRRVGGDVESAFSRAAHRVSVRVAHHRIAPVPMEPRGMLARREDDGGLTV